MLGSQVRLLVNEFLLLTPVNRSLLVDVNHLKSRHDFLLKLVPLDDGVVELNLWQIDEHTSDLGSLVLSNKLFDVLVDDVADDSLLLISILGILVLLRSKHVANFKEVVLGILLLDVLRWS